MTLDHFSSIVLAGGAPILNVLGRIAFPIFVLLVARNLAEDPFRDRRYALRLLAAGAATVPVVWWVKDALYLNVLFTLAASIGLHRVLAFDWGGRLPSLVVGLLGVSALFLLAPALEFGAAGVLFGAATIEWARSGSRSSAALALALLAFANGTTWLAPAAFLALPVWWAVCRFELVLPRGPVWFFYAYYPAQYLVLGMIARALALQLFAAG